MKDKDKDLLEKLSLGYKDFLIYFVKNNLSPKDLYECVNDIYKDELMWNSMHLEISIESNKILNNMFKEIQEARSKENE